MSDTQKKRSLKVPDIAWVEIPAGGFIYGENKDATTLHLDTFEIAHYPITNRQYQCFIDDGGYEDERWWSDLEKPEIEQSSWPQGNRPKIDVDWYEATAFARWLSNSLGKNIRLPNEQEWEKAARGVDGAIYPWGDDYISGHANVDESDIEGDYLAQTIAVGLYPSDESPYGVRDMAGNVIEWCNEIADNSGSKSGNSKTASVLRGGSWGNFPEIARAAYRHGLNPDGRLDDIGFRVVRSPPSGSAAP